MCLLLKVPGERRLKLDVFDSEELSQNLFVYLSRDRVALPSLEFAKLKGLALNFQRFASSSLSWDSRCAPPRLARQILNFTY